MIMCLSTNTFIGLTLGTVALAAGACSAQDSSGAFQNDAQVGGAPNVGAGGGTATANPSSGGAVTGSGGAVTSSGGAVTSSGGAVTGNGGAATGNGGATTSATGNGGATTSATGNGGATTSATGGTTSAAGGTTSATGGKASTAGGATTGTGGTTSATGGKAAIGGAASATGGAGTGGSGTATTTKFSFFVISYKAIQAKSGSAQGFGGDLRYGTGAGLTGADKICTEVAEGSMAGNAKTWQAYLSTSTVNAIDRIGPGPWYDRLGRTVALTKAALLFTRPQGADAAIINDLPNEDGTPNHAPSGAQVDNHDTLTGTNHLGTLFSSTAHCTDWTSSAKDTTKKPRVGHTWPRGTAGTGNTAGMAHWGSALDESGCGAGVNIVETGGPGNDGVVGSGGGYGGWYCFALTP